VRTVATVRSSELDARALYALLRLRVDVFVVEQNCPYPELDGRDLEPSTVHVWTTDDAGPTAYLRILDDGDVARIGRVCTRSDARGSGLAAELMMTALAETAGSPVVLDAQSYLAGWYARFGFVADGPEFVEDGIPHIPMRREPAA
jgi:ElaA protein